MVEALSPGSFRAKIATVYTKARNLFSNQLVMGVVASLIAAYVYEKTISSSGQATVVINTDEVIIQSGNDRLVVPRNVYEATRRAEQLPRFREGVAKASAAVVADTKVASIGFAPELNSPPPDFLIHREDLAVLAGEPTDDGEEKTVEDEAVLQIVRATLEKGRRKWEFVWRGVRISAPILDDAFFDRFSAHSITIGPGDALRVRLHMKQKRESDSGIFTTREYEVVEVLDHIQQAKQMPLATPDGHDIDADDDEA